ncbi:unnamed protein product [Miscanthus lutarioriparius]|uniref:tRNA (guanine(26)-N(2))-dimethyltransferase n=1 Tax=Miscanthus lutarioriparius TaxID=422564 RepID=A0A811MJM3_9POAL|nr:unnamed protein product [Miscanthus lutarioriparius]
MAQVDDKLKDYEIRKEGEAEILLHKRNAVFYNPVQFLWKSISDQVVHSKFTSFYGFGCYFEFTISRYAREVEGLGKVVALDNDKASVEDCKRNIKFNGASATSEVEAYLVDARIHMLMHPKEFDVVDLDPYGSPSIFLDSAVQAVADGGLLMCTATDMAVLCGTNGEVCYSKYGSFPTKGKYCHEMALRILLASIEVHSSASEIKNTPLKLSYIYQCVGCDSFHLQCLARTVPKKNNGVKHVPAIGPVVPQECSDCGKKFNVGGPIWSAPIHDQDWELHDIPLFFSLHNIAGTVKCTSPSLVMFRSAVLNAGYRISSTHVNPLGVKSDAPWDVIWDIMRCWVKNHPIKEQPRDTPGTAILSKSPKLEANFSRAVAALSKARAKKIKRFLPNPERHWGPKVRAGRKITSKHVSLLGPEAINGAVNGGGDCHKEGNGAAAPDNTAPEPEGIKEVVENEPSIKRQKTSDEPASEP